MTKAICYIVTALLSLYAVNAESVDKINSIHVRDPSSNDKLFLEDSRNRLNSDELLSIRISEALSKSKIVLENSEVFIQLGKYLFQNNTKQAQKSSPYRTTPEPIHKPERKVPENDHGKPKEASVPSSKKKIEIKPGYAAWPNVYIRPSNSTVSMMMKPPGYRKRSGDVTISKGIVNKLQVLVDSMTIIHRPSDRSTWETMDFYPKNEVLTARRRWHNAISRHDLYPPDDPDLLAEVMDNLAHGAITQVDDTGDSGTQVKFIVWLEDGSRAMVKPIRFSRETETLPYHYYFADHERHIAEIASFHLDRLLNFRRVPPVTGRLINMTSEIYEKGEESIRDEFFTSPAGNVCYRGKCDYYCNMHHLTCGRPHMIEVSMMAFLPSRTRVKRSSWEHPWRKSYSSKKPADWESDDHYCDGVKKRKFYRSGRRFLDLMDTALFDFLIGNTDRHHFNTFTRWDNFTATMHVDNGKGFGNSKEDEMILLLPVAQCCTIRFTTLRTLLRYHSASVTLGQALKESLLPDTLNPVLLDSHFKAIDRRVTLILLAVNDCIKQKPASQVIIDDGF